MARTRGGHRYRPRVQFSTPERDGAGTSRAAEAHSPDQAAESPPTLAPATIPEEAQASEPPSQQYQTKLGPRALSKYIRDHVGGPRPPSGPEHQARVSLLGLGLSCHLLQLIRVRRLIYHRPRGSCALCSPAIRFQGTWICVPKNSIGSHTMTYRC